MMINLVLGFFDGRNQRDYQKNLGKSWKIRRRTIEKIVEK